MCDGTQHHKNPASVIHVIYNYIPNRKLGVNQVGAVCFDTHKGCE